MTLPTTKSPLDQKSNALHIRDIPISKIIDGYRKFGIDVTALFAGIKFLSLYKCQNSGYEFFLPGNISGDSKFYEKLQNFSWYYMPWKWEHEIALSYLADGNSLLEVGCAHGAFLKGASARYKLSNSTGLEINESTPTFENSFKIINLDLKDFQKDHKNSFDVVCSFQVLEHIFDVHAFLQAKIDCLKPGGKLLISVPNNDSFVGKSSSVLNMPPHHVGLWNSGSLKYLEQLFSIKLETLLFEPLQPYHVESHIQANLYSKLPRWLSIPIKRLDKVTGKHKKLKAEIEAKASFIAGHTVLAVFSKL